MDSTVRVTLIHLNDVYEVTPVDGEGDGGLARVATLQRELASENPNTFTVLAGDFLSPSAIGTARVDGTPIAGRQMIDVLNTMELDVATFGNHEFDLGLSPLQDRIAESRFIWISSNVVDSVGRPFPGVAGSTILRVHNRSGVQFRLAIVAATLDENRESFVRYLDPVQSIRQAIDSLPGPAEAVVALTHLRWVDDARLAEAVPDIDLIMGGHEHENLAMRRGPTFTPIYKADANARTVYVHRLTYDAAAGSVRVESELIPLGRDVAEDSATAAVAREWMRRGFAGFEERGFVPREVVGRLTESLDGLSATVRTRATGLTRLIADGMMHAAPGTRLALFNAGSIRVDDVLRPGPITQYDVLRVLPFEGLVFTVDLRGALLTRLLTTGVALRGTGGFVQATGNVEQRGVEWWLGSERIDPALTYRVAINEYLANGGQSGLEFVDVNASDDAVTLVRINGDLRQAVIAELRSVFPPR